MSLMMCSYSEKRTASFVEKILVKTLFKKKKKAVLITKLVFLRNRHIRSNFWRKNSAGISKSHFKSDNLWEMMIYLHVFLEPMYFIQILLGIQLVYLLPITLPSPSLSFFPFLWSWKEKAPREKAAASSFPQLPKQKATLSQTTAKVS